MDQRYVSGELTHFVGAYLRDDHDKQYELLLRIMRSGEIRAGYRVPPLPRDSNPDAVGPYFHHKPGTDMEGIVITTPEGSLVGGTMHASSMVCFCDIPVADLGIHMSKYSRFGLSFRKAFLVGYGASPVFYVSTDALIHKRRGGGERLGEVLDGVARDLSALQDRLEEPDLRRLLEDECVHRGFWAISKLRERILAFVKGFDTRENEDSPKNTYLEREWRVTRSVPFALGDVYRIILPEAYAKRFRDDLPEYTGQLTYAGSLSDDSLAR